MNQNQPPGRDQDPQPALNEASSDVVTGRAGK
jgi:hypothetical protein